MAGRESGQKIAIRRIDTALAERRVTVAPAIQQPGTRGIDKV
jgi:hypothetical protein